MAEEFENGHLINVQKRFSRDRIKNGIVAK